MKKIILLTCFLISLLGIAQQGAIDTSFNPSDLGFGKGDGANSWIQTSVMQPDGKLIVGGGFSTYNGVQHTLIARLNPDGTLDPSFNTGTIASYGVYRLALQSDGKIIFAGSFSTYNGVPCKNIGRLNADGSLDTTFKSGTGASDPNDQIQSLCVQADDKIIIGGHIYTYNGTTTKNIVRLNADGSLDSTFNAGTGFNNIAYTISLAPQGKYIVGGAFTAYNGTTSNYLCRLNSDGSLDTSFNSGTGPSSYVYETNIQPDGLILIGGNFTTYNGKVSNRIARLNSDGTMDMFFTPGSGADNTVYASTLQADGKIIIGGTFTTYNGSSRRYFTRLNANGTLDLTFNTGTGPDGGIVRSANLLADGKMIICGAFTTYNGIVQNRIARLDASGTLDTTFNPSSGANDNVRSISQQPDGKAIIAGNFTSYNSTARTRIARINSDGSLDNTFNPGTGTDTEIYSTALQSDGKIIICGNFLTYNGTTRKRVARINADGSLDTTFNASASGASDLVNRVVLQSDGKIIIVGRFLVYNGVSRNMIARLNTDGSTDTTFSGNWANQEINTVAIQPDGKILIGGNFNSNQGALFNKIGRMNPDGYADETFKAGAPNGLVLAIAVQPDGKIIMGGDFTTYKGVARNRIARLNADGSLDTTFNVGSGLDNSVYEINVQSDGKIIIGGAFTKYNGVSQNKIVRLNTDGSLDATFNVGANGDVRSILPLQDGKIIIAGAFTAYNGIGRNRIARIYGETGAISSITAFTPNSGCANSTSVTITGTNFTGATAVTIGEVAVSSFTVNSATSITAMVGAGATGKISVSTPAGTGLSTDSFTVNTPSIAPTSISGTTTICNGGSTTLTQVGGSLGTDATYKWYTGSCGGTLVGTGTSITVSPTETTTYYILAEGVCNTTSCTTALVTVNSLSSTPTSISGKTTICNGGSTTLTQVDGSLGTDATYKWYTGSCGGTLVGTGTSITVSPTETKSYHVLAEGACNTTDCATVTVIVNSLSTAPTSISGTTTICYGGSATLSQIGGSLGTEAIYKWYTGSCGGTLVGTGTSITVSPTETTTYHVLAEGVCNTTSCTTATVTVNSSSSAPTSISGETTICNGGSTTLSQVGGSLGTDATYKWYTGSCGGTLVGTGTSITVSPTEMTTYYIIAEGVCNTTSCTTATVTVNSSSSAPTSISGETTICNGGSTTLSQVGGSLGTDATYKWYTGSCGGTLVGTGTSITVTPATTTTYYILAEGTCNTTACRAVLVTVQELEAPDISYNSKSPQIYNVGITITPLTPLNMGGAVAASGYTVSPALPPGLVFDTTTGIISGTPITTSAAKDYTITATNASGSSTVIINIGVNVVYYTSIPDPNFEQALIDLGLDTAPVDGKVPTANISGVVNLDVSNKNISNLTGIEDFAALTSLNCSHNQLTSLDVTKNTALTYLDCSHNKLGSVNTSGKTSISTTLDVTKNTALTYLDCSYNQLTVLDVTKNTALTYLNCSNNQLVNLNINNGNNSIITTFNVTNNSTLTAIQADSITPPNSGWTKDTTAYYTSTILSSPAFQKNSVMLYPNPADSIINIMAQEMTDIVVMNFLGQQIMRKSIYGNQTMIDISSLSEGTYLVKVIYGDRSTVFKVIKK